MKNSLNKYFCLLISLLLVGTVTSVLAYPEWHENSNGWNYGTHGTAAYAYVGGWWWGTAYCNPPGYPFIHIYGHSPPEAYWEPAHFGQCGYNTAWTRTKVYWQDQYGQYHLDIQAFAAI